MQFQLNVVSYFLLGQIQVFDTEDDTFMKIHEKIFFFFFFCISEICNFSALNFIQSMFNLKR